MAGPIMQKRGYDTALSAGTITAGGTLGILIPPSVMLVVMGPSFQVSVARLYAAAILPGLAALVPLPRLHVGRAVVEAAAWSTPAAEELNVSSGFIVRELVVGFLPPTFLILLTLGAIISGWATPTEGAALGCAGAILISAFSGKLTLLSLKDAAYRTAETTSMVMILLAASTFLGSVFSAFGTPKFLADTILLAGISHRAC